MIFLDWYLFNTDLNFKTKTFHTNQYSFRQDLMFFKEFVSKVITRCVCITVIWLYEEICQKIFSCHFDVATLTETAEPVLTTTRAYITLTADQNKIFAKYMWRDVCKTDISCEETCEDLCRVQSAYLWHMTESDWQVKNMRCLMTFIER